MGDSLQIPVHHRDELTRIKAQGQIAA